MYRNTRFRELMKGLPRGNFEKVVDRLEADKYNKGFRSWDQMLAMIYAQISGCQSLRELEAGFNSQAVHHYHLGSREIKRSTLSDANNKRATELFSTVCNQLFGQMHRKIRKELKELLYLLDSTPIPLKGLGFDEWALENHNARTSGLKVHIQLATSGTVPVYQRITAPNVNDIEVGRTIPLEAGATYVFDKGYCDYNWWYKLQQEGALFVTRFKKNAGIKTVRQRKIPQNADLSILEDAEVTFRNKHPGGKRINHYHGTSLRKVVVSRPDHKEPLVLATNDFKRSAEEIAELYKKRWEIELFFKWLKQNLKIKKFLGRSENAVKIQIYTALISYILVQMYRIRNGITQSLKLCLISLRSGLFQRPEVEQEIAHRRRKRRLEVQSLQGVLPI